MTSLWRHHVFRSTTASSTDSTCATAAAQLPVSCTRWVHSTISFNRYVVKCLQAFRTTRAYNQTTLNSSTFHAFFDNFFDPWYQKISNLPNIDYSPAQVRGRYCNLSLAALGPTTSTVENIWMLDYTVLKLPITNFPYLIIHSYHSWFLWLSFAIHCHMTSYIFWPRERRTGGGRWSGSHSLSILLKIRRFFLEYRISDRNTLNVWTVSLMCQLTSTAPRSNVLLQLAWLQRHALYIKSAVFTMLWLCSIIDDWQVTSQHQYNYFVEELDKVGGDKVVL